MFEVNVCLLRNRHQERIKHARILLSYKIGSGERAGGKLKELSDCIAILALNEGEWEEWLDGRHPRPHVAIMKVQQDSRGPWGTVGCQKSLMSPQNGAVPAVLSCWLGTAHGKGCFGSNMAMNLKMSGWALAQMCSMYLEAAKWIFMAAIHFVHFLIETLPSLIHPPY